jgi:HK97 family phage prohead protease
MDKLLVKKMTLDGKEVSLEIKQTGKVAIKVLDEQLGIIEAYVSIFGNIDSYGDVVEKGAFADCIANYFPRYPKGVWSHDWTQPIAKTLEIREDERGLYVKAQLLLDIQKGKEAYILIKEGVVTDFSFGYEVDESQIDEQTGIRHLKKLTIYEWSPVLVGANNRATILSVKSDGQEVTEAKKAKSDPEDDQEGPDADDTYPDFISKTLDDAKQALTDEWDRLEELEDQEEDQEGDGKSKKIRIKVGRVLSAQNEGKIRSAIDGIDALVANANDIKKLFEDLLGSLEQAGESGVALADQTARVDQRGIKNEHIKLILKDAQAAVKANQKVIVRLKSI